VGSCTKMLLIGPEPELELRITKAKLRVTGSVDFSN